MQTCRCLQIHEKERPGLDGGPAVSNDRIDLPGIRLPRSITAAADLVVRQLQAADGTADS